MKKKKEYKVFTAYTLYSLYFIVVYSNSYESNAERSTTFKTYSDTIYFGVGNARNGAFRWKYMCKMKTRFLFASIFFPF